METDRFETFFDAIIAIIITVLVLKIPQPTTPTLAGILELQNIYIAYLISFLILYNIWYANHNLFRAVDNIDNITLWIYGVMTFVISLLPYFTIWIANNVYSIPAETMFGVIFIATHILNTAANWTIVKSNPYSNIHDLQITNPMHNIPLIVMAIGFILTYTVYIPGIYITCLLSIVLWILIARFTREGENGN
ncbi:TMEM175 family protein [uncultured Methanobrevibacter sp.]|uniref:TMEM175 family protein n=1 Tax=uncultured Methanobrevibacter sp. TaxID=253161 RepID=UPI0025EFAA50|nr:TMEM175 family protein [uncultured Methanobrevibacter sp.]MDO5810998.1 TMEM175 family protein [Methanobrevibacter sp.]